MPKHSHGIAQLYNILLQYYKERGLFVLSVEQNTQDYVNNDMLQSSHDAL